MILGCCLFAASEWMVSCSLECPLLTLCLLSSACALSFVPDCVWADFKVVSASVAYGGMNKVPVVAPATEQYLVGKKWTREMLEGAYKCLEKA